MVRGFGSILCAYSYGVPRTQVCRCDKSDEYLVHLYLESAEPFLRRLLFCQLAGRNHYFAENAFEDTSFYRYNFHGLVKCLDPDRRLRICDGEPRIANMSRWSCIVIITRNNDIQPFQVLQDNNRWQIMTLSTRESWILASVNANLDS